jgi:hypothetical protein
MRLLIVADAGRTRRWMARLAESLGAAGHDLRLATLAAPPAPGLLAQVLELERLLIGRLRPSGADPVAAETIAPPPDAGFAADLVLDFSSDPAPPAGPPRLAVHFDGTKGEDAAVAALTAGATPLVEIVDPADGRVVERALPSMEAAEGLRGGLDALAARIVTLLRVHLDALALGRPRPVPPLLAAVPRGTARAPAQLLARNLAVGLARRIYRLCCHAPHWRVGWRLHEGPGIAETGDFSGPAFRVLADPGHHFYADPFAATRNGETHVFVEDLDHRLGRGVVSAIPFGPSGPIGPARVVLDEPWHLSYPFLIEEAGELYMIPESSGAGDVALYRCTAFPDRWERVATLVDDADYSDATVFRHAGRWWMFGTVHDGAGGWSDTLEIRFAPSLFGPWQRHPVAAPLVDRSSARPAGNVFRRGDRLFRPAQDCSTAYGGALVLAEITRLDEEGFAQEIRHHLTPGRHWPGRRLHTLNRVGRLELIDGSVIRPKARLLVDLVEARTRPESPR